MMWKYIWEIFRRQQGSFWRIIINFQLQNYGGEINNNSKTNKTTIKYVEKCKYQKKKTINDLDVINFKMKIILIDMIETWQKTKKGLNKS